MMNNPMRQQTGQMQRGNPMIEQLMAQLMQGMMPPQMGAGIGLPQQQGMGGFGQMARMSPNYGTSPLKRMKGTTNYKQFLQQHSMYGKKVNMPIDNARLLRF
jgi:hypothetical protein